MTGAEAIGGAAAKAIISPLIKTTWNYVNEKLNAIREKQRDNAKATVEYLDSVLTIMTTLEAESDEIFLSASRLSRVDPDDAAATANALQDRLEAFLIGEHLRPQLMELLGRLQSSTKTLEDDAQRFFGIGKVPDDKQIILDELQSACTYIQNYLGYLGPYASGPSGVYRLELLNLLEKLHENARRNATSRQQGKQAIGQYAWDILMNRQPWFVVRAERMGNLIESIRAKMAKN